MTTSIHNSSRMRNSELAKKLKARAANNRGKQEESDQTRLLQGHNSSSSTTNPGQERSPSSLSDPYARFPFLAPFIACNSPSINDSKKNVGTDVASPSGMNQYPGRGYPILNSPQIQRQQVQPSQIQQKGEKRQNVMNFKIADKPQRAVQTNMQISAHSRSDSRSLSSPSLNTFSSANAGGSSSTYGQQQSHEVNYFDSIEYSYSNRERCGTYPPRTLTPGSDNSSLETCAPSTVIMAGSTSATCPSVNPSTASDTSSLLTCAPSTVVMALSTSTTCPGYTKGNPATPQRNNCRSPPPPRNSPKGSPKSSPKSKNLLRLIYDIDDGKPEGDAKKGKKKKEQHSKPGWMTSPFQKGRKKKDSPAIAGRRTAEGVAIPENRNNAASGIIDGTSIPRRHSFKQPQRRGSPVDLDEVSADSHEHNYYDDDTEAGYYSDPTDADLRNQNYFLQPERHTDPSYRSTGHNMLADRKHLDNERVLSQLGMDVHEEDYCIEGEFTQHRYQSKGSHRRASSGRWNYHQRRPSYIYGTGPRLDIGEVIMAGDVGKEEKRRRGSELGENIKESMKKSFQKIGDIIKTFDDEDSSQDRARRKRQHHNASNNETPKLGSKVLSMLRGGTKQTNIPQSIIITPTPSEDPEISMNTEESMTTEEYELMQRWQMARARCRESASAPVTPAASPYSSNISRPATISNHERQESETTTHADNRRMEFEDGPGPRTDYSF